MTAPGAESGVGPANLRVPGVGESTVGTPGDSATGDRPKLLLIETSGRGGRVGLSEGPDLVAERLLDDTRRHARDLAPAVAALLRARSWRPRDLGGVIVSLGPGSYT